MKKKIVLVALVSLAVVPIASFGYKRDDSQYCHSSRYYTCVKVASGRTVAIPRHHIRDQDEYPYVPQHVTYRGNDHAPRKSQKHAAPRAANIPSKISSGNIIKVDLGALTWAAYDDDGNLVKSGHVSGGKDYCPDIGRRCRTVTGTFTIYTKKGAECKSSRFPVNKGGAPMPYCMFFKGGYALHGSNSVPNYNASHGCVRMAPSDAQWLNQDFVRVGSTRVNVTY